MKLIFRYLKPYWPAVLLVLVLILARAMSELFLPRIMSLIVDIGIVGNDIPYILKAGLLMLGINLAGMVCAFGSSFWSAKVAMNVSAKIRHDLFERVNSFSLRDMDRFGASSLITRITNDVVQVQNVTLMSMRIMLMAPLMMVGGIIMAVSQDSSLSAVLWVVLPLLSVLIWFFARRAVPLFSAIQQKTDQLNRVVRENLSGLRVIRAFNKRNFETDRFSGANRELTNINITVSKLMAGLMPLIMLFLNLAIVLVLWLGAGRVNTGSIQIGSLMAFIQYVGQILFSLVMVSMLFVMIPRASVSLKRIDEVLGHRPSIVSPVAARSVPACLELEFDHVSFRYPGAEALALEDITFRCRAGETIAIIGGTGSGKTSLINLVCRFHDAESGAVRLDGIDIRELALEDLRSRLSLVPQKSFLFSGSVDENLRYGRRSAQDTELEQALAVAQAAGFVGDMPEGRQTQIARGGTTVSGGQRQRLAIARALVRPAAIYLFDDSFSALDTRTEQALRAALAQRTGSSIVLLVTQRVSSARRADRILVLDDGKLCGIGTHQELAAGNAVYREIMGSQLDKEGDHE